MPYEVQMLAEKRDCLAWGHKEVTSNMNGKRIVCIESQEIHHISKDRMST